MTLVVKLVRAVPSAKVIYGQIVACALRFPSSFV